MYKVVEFGGLKENIEGGVMSAYLCSHLTINFKMFNDFYA